MSMLLSLALQAAAPQLAEPRTFQDWIVGCDNGRACHAIALATFEDGNDGWLTLGLRRAAGGDAEPVITISAREEPCGATLVADGRRLPVRIIEAQTCSIVHPADVPALVQALRAANTLEAFDAEGRSLGNVSLRGASAAMLFIDEAQGRLDTETALVRRGARPASAVPAPPPLPIVPVPPRAEDGPLQLDAARVTALRRQTGCTIDEVGGPDEFDAVPLAPGKTLVLLACGTGAYNLSSVVLIAEQQGSRIAVAPAPFDVADVLQEANQPILVNAEWDGENRVLHDFPRGRGIGDCGTRSRYVWDGSRFRLIHRETMGECRGSIDFITVWRTRVARPQN